MLKDKNGRQDYLLILLLLFAAVILLTNLGNIYLWQDEAHTAVLAKNTLRFGVPRSFDGKNLVVNIFKDPCMYKPEKYSSWLQYYLTAFSFWLFGQTTHAARVPFALLGIFSVGLCYALTQKMFNDNRVSRIAAAFMVFSAPFFLYIRQCRWYALTIFFTLWVLLSYVNTVKKEKHSALAFIVGNVLLFHSNYGIFFPVFMALIAHSFIFNRENIRKFLSYFIVIALLILPFIIYYANAEIGGILTLQRIKGHVEFYFRVLNKYLFPVGLLFFSLILFSLFRKRVFPILTKPLNRSYVWLLIFVFIFTIAFLLLADERQLRYIVHLLPLCSILMGLLIMGLLKVNSIVAALIFVIVCFTNIVHTGSPFRKKLWIPQVSIAYELTHDYDGPVEGIVKFLAQNTRADDTVKIIYGDFAVIFYTDLKVDNRPFATKTFPEWIVVRRDWFPLQRLPDGYRRQIESRYQKIVLNYPDIRWENRPDPGYHKFKTVSAVPNVLIYKKR